MSSFAPVLELAELDLRISGVKNMCQKEDLMVVMEVVAATVEMAGMATCSRSPMRMTVPLPNCRSIWLSAAASARFLFSSIVFSSLDISWVHP